MANSRPSSRRRRAPFNGSATRDAYTKMNLGGNFNLGLPQLLTADAPFLGPQDGRTLCNVESRFRTQACYSFARPALRHSPVQAKLHLARSRRERLECERPRTAPAIHDLRRSSLMRQVESQKPTSPSFGLGRSARDAYRKQYLNKLTNEAMPREETSGIDFIRPISSYGRQPDSRFPTSPSHSFGLFAPNPRPRRYNRKEGQLRSTSGAAGEPGEGEADKAQRPGRSRRASAGHFREIVELMAGCEKCSDQLDVCSRCLRNIDKICQPPPPPPLSHDVLNKIYKEVEAMRNK